MGTVGFATTADCHPLPPRGAGLSQGKLLAPQTYFTSAAACSARDLAFS